MLSWSCFPPLLCNSYFLDRAVVHFITNAFVCVRNSGILLYEMLYGRTPFRGKNRQRTFTNILHKDLTFPGSIPVYLRLNCASILSFWTLRSKDG